MWNLLIFHEANLKINTRYPNTNAYLQSDSCGPLRYNWGSIYRIFKIVLFLRQREHLRLNTFIRHSHEFVMSCKKKKSLFYIKFMISWIKVINRKTSHLIWEWNIDWLKLFEFISFKSDLQKIFMNINWFIAWPYLYRFAKVWEVSSDNIHFLI